MKNDDLHGRRILVTGASRGIGRAIAVAVADAGAAVGVHCARDTDAAAGTMAKLRGDGHAVLVADLGDPAAAAALADEAAEALGGLDIVVNNAGIFEAHPPTGSSREQWLAAWRRHLDVNLLGPACLCHAALPYLEQSDAGRIVNITSRGAYRGEPECPAYGATKAGLNAMSQSLAQALAPRGIVVTAVAPGWVETDMTTAHLDGVGGDEIRAQSPLGRVARADEIADVVRFLCATDAAYISGAVIDVNGASHLR